MTLPHSTLGPLTQKLLSALVEEEIEQDEDDKEDYSLPSPEHPVIMSNILTQ